MTHKRKSSAGKRWTTRQRFLQLGFKFADESMSADQRTRFLKRMGRQDRRSKQDFEDLTPQISSEEKLIRAVLEQAVMDAVFPHKLGGPHRQAQAAEFLRSESEEPFSARWIISHIYDDVDSAQRQLLRFITDEEYRQAQLERAFGTGRKRFDIRERRPVREARTNPLSLPSHADDQEY